MKEMGWTYQELMETPYEMFLDITRIQTLEAKYEQKKNKKMENKVDSV